MAEYTIVLTKTAQKQSDKFLKSITQTASDAIEKLAGDPRPEGYKKLKGCLGYRIRKGDYRIIYTVQDDVLTIDVVAIGLRVN